MGLLARPAAIAALALVLVPVAARADTSNVVFPVTGPVVAWRDDYGTTTAGARQLGNTIGVKAGTPVVAVAGGRVRMLWQGGRGWNITLTTSDGNQFSYLHLGADLVLLGQQASDSDSYVMAAAVAEHLQLPLVTQVARLELTDGGIRANRQTETGYDVVEAPLPAVVSVSDAINEPRYASLKAIMGARKKPQTTLALADLGVESGSGTEVLELTPPAVKEGGRRIEDENGSSAEEIVAFLVERKAI